MVNFIVADLMHRRGSLKDSKRPKITQVASLNALNPWAVDSGFMVDSHEPPLAKRFVAAREP
jgi:hypothetical protein